jgi:hypothetical protein
VNGRQRISLPQRELRYAEDIILEIIWFSLAFGASKRETLVSVELEEEFEGKELGAHFSFITRSFRGSSCT